ncbi:MAG: hypothetical protein FWG40_12410 [Peptococcaceae bacterium]|nr:hypothetical protein [Peptococcaceae bacterium]
MIAEPFQDVGLLGQGVVEGEDNVVGRDGFRISAGQLDAAVDFLFQIWGDLFELFFIGGDEAEGPVVIPSVGQPFDETEGVFFLRVVEQDNLDVIIAVEGD